MLLATARFVITTVQRKFLYFFVFFFPKVPRSIEDENAAIYRPLEACRHFWLHSAVLSSSAGPHKAFSPFSIVVFAHSRQAGRPPGPKSRCRSLVQFRCQCDRLCGRSPAPGRSSVSRCRGCRAGSKVTPRVTQRFSTGSLGSP